MQQNGNWRRKPLAFAALFLATLIGIQSTDAQPPPPQATPKKEGPIKIIPPSQAARYRFEPGTKDAVPEADNPIAKILARFIRRPATPVVLQQTYHELWQSLGDHYYDPSRLRNWELKRIPEKPIDGMESFDLALEKLFDSLEDRWTSYHGKTQIDKARAKQKAGIHGLGFSLRPAGSTHVVASVVFGGPAHETRIRPGDQVVSIGGTDLDGLNKAEAEALLEAKLESVVPVRIRHRLEDGAGEPVGSDTVEETVEITIKETPDPVLDVRLLPGGLAYARLPNFMNDQTDAYLQVAYLHLMKSLPEGQIEGLILDLRNNPGGRFDMALAVASLFLNGTEEAVPGTRGLICSAMSRDDRRVSESRYRVIERLPYLANAGEEEARKLLHLLSTKPLVVLINGSSASSSEVVAGALRDNKRADATIGDPTYGKSVGYQLSETPWGGRFSITTMEYLTPAGHDVAREGGVQPTIRKRQPRGAKIDEQLAAAVSFLTRAKFEPIDNKPTTTSDEDWLWQYRWTIAAATAAVFLAMIMVARRRRHARHQDTGD